MIKVTTVLTPGAVARSEACLLGMQVAPSLIPTSGTFYHSGTTVLRQKAKLSSRSGRHQILLVFGIKDINSHIQILNYQLKHFENIDPVFQCIFFNFSVKTHGLFHQICLE